MRWNDIDTMTCSIARTLSVVGDRWTMLIIRDVFLGIRRFELIQRDLAMTPHRLSDRLRKLVREGILMRVKYQDRPVRFEYRLSEKGVDLYPLLVALLGWGDRWMSGSAGAPVELVHRKCGHAITPMLTCPHCKDAIVAREMSARPGPALKYRARTSGAGRRRATAGMRSSA
ncbi:MAG TPA: helix-turn-helix domain-containing protein [Candidatus Binataceae bacterium]|nr:helix-turn-helix domain-containing protein [Candidatus Binataceae bacterium]